MFLLQPIRDGLPVQLVVLISWHTLNLPNVQGNGVALHPARKRPAKPSFVEFLAGYRLDHGGESILPCNDTGNRPATVPDRRRHLIQLDPEASNLHLKIQPLPEIHLAIVAFGPIAGRIAVHESVTGDLQWAESASAHGRLLPIPIGKLGTRDDDLSFVRMATADKIQPHGGQLSARSCKAVTATVASVGP